MINLEPADGSPAARDLLDTGHPDEQGLFRTLGVPPGQYIVKISGHPLAGWVFKGAQFEGRDLADTPVDLQSRDIAGVVLTFTDRPSTLEGIVRNGANPDGEAVVMIYPIDAEAWSIGGASPRRMRAARTMKDGSFSVTNLPAGEYLRHRGRGRARGLAGPGRPPRLRARGRAGPDSGWRTQVAQPAHGEDSMTRHAAALSAVVIIAGLSAHAQAPRDPRAAATGTALLRGTVVSDDVEAKPVRRARVTCTAPELTEGMTAVTDDRGRFSCARLPAGR